MEEKKSFFDGAFGRYLLPGVILQSVLIGGGYATGREIIEYGAKFGAKGWLAGLGIFIGFVVVAILTFEMARLYRIYDYKYMVKEIAGPLWRLYDVIYVVLMLVVIAIMASATGNIVEQTIGLNYWFGVVGVIVIVGILNFYGEALIERFETYGTLALYAGYILFAFLVIRNTAPNIQRVFAVQDTSFLPNVSTLSVLWNGLIYVAFNLVVMPASFFTLKRQTKRKETVISGIIAGALMTIPWFLTYFAVMGFYPAEGVLTAEVPWLAMMKGVAGPIVISIFGIVMGWTLIETSTGIIHALIERINSGLQEGGRAVLSRGQQGFTTVLILVIATVLSKFGIIDLVAKGYSLLAYGFILIYLVPLLTVGVYKIVKGSPIKRNVEQQAVSES